MNISSKVGHEMPAEDALNVQSIVEVYRWKPRAGINFGDHIGPMVMERLLQAGHLGSRVLPVDRGGNKLLAVGSILHEAQNGDHIWGSGVNGKTWLPEAFGKLNLKFHSVRGPITRQAAVNFGHDVPECYGDPGLLFPMLFDREIEIACSEMQSYYLEKKMRIPRLCFIPNINDERFYLPEINDLPGDCVYISPSLDPIQVAAYIRLSEKVISSSLHGIVFADAYGREATFIQSRFETLLKYDDYFLGTGRGEVSPVKSLAEALNVTNVQVLPDVRSRIIEAFPFFLEASAFAGLVLKMPTMKIGCRYMIDGDQDARHRTSLIFNRGWSHVADGSIWSIGNEIEINFAVPHQSPKDLKLRMNLGTLPKGNKHYEKLRILNSREGLVAFTIERDKPDKVVDIPLPSPDPETGLIQLRGRLENASIPKEFGISEDGRVLGAWTSWFELVGTE